MMKKQVYYNAFLILSICLLPSCGKQKNRSDVAHNYLLQAQMAAKKNLREALSLVEKSIKTYPTFKAQALKATFLYGLEKYDESARVFETILSGKRGSKTLKADAQNNYACTLLKLGKKEKAKKVWEELAGNTAYLCPEVAWYNLGLLSLHEAREVKEETETTKHLWQAVRYFTYALDVNNDYIDAYYYLALAFIDLQEYQRARDTLVQIITLMPNHKPAQKLLTDIEKKLGTNTKA